MQQFKLKIICTTDLHMELDGHDELTGAEMSGRGLNKLADLVNDERADAPAVVVDNGDFLQGTPLADHLAGSKDHPLASMINEIGYDFVNLGNHDFDYGIPALVGFLKQLNATVIASNVSAIALEQRCETWALAHRTLHFDDEERTLCLGVVGVVPPQTVNWAGLPAQDIQITDGYRAADHAAKKAKEAGADLVIALCHGGAEDQIKRDNMENAAYAISQIDHIDVVLAGHTHAYLPQNGPEHVDRGVTPILQSGAHAKSVGVLDLNLVWDEGWGLRSAVAQHRYASEIKSPRISKHPTLTVARQNLRRHFDVSVGTLDRPLNNFYAPLGYDDAARLINEAIIEHLRGQPGSPIDLQKLIVASSSYWSSGSAEAPRFLATEGLIFTERDLYTVAPFDNQICVIERTGFELRKWIADCSAFFGRLDKGKTPQHLLSGTFPSYLFDCFTGLEYDIDVTQPVTDPYLRVPVLSQAGHPITDTDKLNVAVSTYRARGGGGLFDITNKDLIWQCDEGLRAMLRGLFAASAKIDLGTAPFWHFTPMPDTEAFLVLPTRNTGRPLPFWPGLKTELTQDGTRVSLPMPKLAQQFT